MLTRMLKLAFYGVFAYLIYETVRGITRQVGSDRGGSDQPNRPERTASPSNITGFSGEGMSVPVADSTGAEHLTRVGRGVVSR